MTTRGSTPHGTPCWADLWTTDVEGSRRFYSQLFGWEALAPSPEFGGYWMFNRQGAPVAGGMGSMGELKANNTWKPYFCTNDIAATLKEAGATGATVQMGAAPVADLGVQAVVTDPMGTVFGLWQPGTFDGFHVMGEASAPSWFELHTPDHARAVGFYSDLFGYEVGDVPGTDEYLYSRFRSPGSDEDFGGIMGPTTWSAEGGGHWDIYWHVNDVPAAIEATKSLGGSLKRGPDKTPYGVLALATDPAGADFRLRAAP
ncbi:MAG TPA: VOC family protein [Acidimicrobiales bacterium]|nr:VOC family protein [Acidimicrobiales bacterium]